MEVEEEEMKKKIVSLLAISMLGSILTGCGGPVEVDKDGDGKLEIICTIYPVYDWVSQIAGDKANVTYLLDSGVDLHNFQPSVKDLVNIKESDLFIYVGGHSDDWATDIIDRSFNSVNLLELAGEHTIDEQEVEGMQAEEDGHSHAHEDEHVWMSINTSEEIVEGIIETLVEIDPNNAKYYEDNGDSYLEELEELEDLYDKSLDQFAGETIIVADRFPFLYLVSDYEIEYFAAFAGCSSELEVSFETLKFLTDKFDELDQTYMFQLEESGQKIASTILGSEKNILTLNSMQSITGELTEISYISIMKENLEVLLKALSTHKGVDLETINSDIEAIEEIQENEVTQEDVETQEDTQF